ncbi:MAG: glycoside hydrolase family 6 protein [Candidatus Dormibacteraeota bacterium]|nr:glycoside hydrolase family 6 protein [Candidatus Dormibacteraeota bacterium]
MTGACLKRCLAGAATAAIAVLSVLASTAGAQAASRPLPASTHFYAPGFETPAKQQWAGLIANGDRKDAGLLAGMEHTPRAVWIDGGSPNSARVTVAETADRAAGKGQVPVFVAYNIPGRDCGGLSAGGAQNTAQYEAWINGIAQGLGNHHAVLILEPDSLGLLPSTNCGGPSTSYPFTDAERYTELNQAVDRLEKQPNVSVYLDGTHSAWLNVADASSRLVAAGVQRAQGFFLNVSNFQFTPNLRQYGTWISDCITYATAVKQGDFSSCPDQYWNGGPSNNFNGVALSPYGAWSNDAAQQDLNTSGENERYATMLGGTQPTTHFVIDTSRNGQGPWQPTISTPDPQDWCNPPGRGLGTAPTASTGNALVDAYLWIKVPGESDGQCNRGVSGSSVDPVWAAITGNQSFVDPAAGKWFPQEALQLARGGG